MTGSFGQNLLAVSPATPVQVLPGCPVTRTHNLLAHKTPPTKNNGQAEGGKQSHHQAITTLSYKTIGTTSNVSQKTNIGMILKGNIHLPVNTEAAFPTFCRWHLLADYPIMIWFILEEAAQCVLFLKQDFSAGVQRRNHMF